MLLFSSHFGGKKEITCDRDHDRDSDRNSHSVTVANRPQYLYPQRIAHACLDCPEGFACPFNGTTTPSTCPDETVTPSKSISCGKECDYENYFYNTTNQSCQPRKVFCNYSRQYEVATPLNRTVQGPYPHASLIGQRSTCLPFSTYLPG
jgi:hypothetical protein